jgi:biotin carboxyl carrier protein
VKYFVTLADRTYEVQVSGQTVTVDGQPIDAQLGAVPGTPLHHLLLGSESWTVAVEPVEGPSGATRWVMQAVGERRDVAIVDERTKQIQDLTGKRAPAQASGIVRAPMPGMVVRIEVAVGDRVRPGTGLAVVEAMKMENELRAAGVGVVAAIHVQPGQAVEKGAPLVTIQLTGP